MAIFVVVISKIMFSTIGHNQSDALPRLMGGGANLLTINNIFSFLQILKGVCRLVVYTQFSKIQ